MALTTRTNKGSKLSIAEMDENLRYLSMTLSGSVQFTGSLHQLNTTGSGANQVIFGQYNVNGDNTSPFIVGAGSNTGSAEKDAFKVTQSGSIVMRMTSSVAPSWTGTDGEIIPATIGGVSYLYMSMGGTWTSRSFA